MVIQLRLENITKMHAKFLKQPAGLWKKTSSFFLQNGISEKRSDLGADDRLWLG